jgi:hypothetical protein
MSLVKLMNRILLTLALLTSVSALAQQPLVPGQLVVTNTSTTVPVALSSSVIKARSITIYAKQHYRVENAGTVYIGFQSTNQNQFYQLTPGSHLVLEAPIGYVYNLSTIYLDPDTANDGVVVNYQ